jgi:alpha-L-fucosidase
MYNQINTNYSKRIETTKHRTPLLRCVLFSALMVSLLNAAVPPAETPAQRDTRMQWWREARFGMFVHWGLYSGMAGTWEGKAVGTTGGMEWIQQLVKADTDTYAQAAMPHLKPTPGCAKEWARLAHEAGCRYVVFTTKHHEGFALHASKASNFNAGVQLNRDLVREFVEACRAEGLRVGFYHSLIDWHHDQYAYLRSKSLPHPLQGRPYPNGQRDHSKYLTFLHAQVSELVSNYGKIDIMWWDYSGVDFQGDEAWRSTDLMRLVREHQPEIIMNNRLFHNPEAGWSVTSNSIVPKLDRKYGDFLTPEQEIPASAIPGVDWESCMTLNTTWGYSEHDHAWKSAERLLRDLIDVASKGGNYLLNIGPKGDGSIPVESVCSFQAIGRWMRVNGESIYGTTASPLGALPWGRCTAKRVGSSEDEPILYFHVFSWPTDGRLVLPGLAARSGRPVRILGSAEPVSASSNGNDLLLTLPSAALDPIATVIRLD